MRVSRRGVVDSMGIESLEPRQLMAAGDLDPSFGTGGKVVTDLNLFSENANDVAIAGDGGILVAGNAGGFLLAKYLPDGSFDPAFGTAGKVSRSGAGPAAIAVQPDGKTLLAGSGYTNEIQPRARGVVYRFNADGTPDNTFHNDGSVALVIDTSRHVNFYAVALQGDGKVVAVGSETHLRPGGGGDYDENWVVARFNPDGSPDTTFSGDGWLTINFPDNGTTHDAYGVAVQPDGKIAVVGSVMGSPTGVFSTGLAVARLTTTGQLDASFDGDGRAVVAWGPFGSGNSSNAGLDIVALDDGKLLVSGRRGSRPAVYRLNADGTPDNAFGGGGDGAYVHPAGDVVPFTVVNDLAVLPDGHIVLAGGSSNTVNGDMAALVLTENGTPDSAFGGDGLATADFGGGETASAVAVQRDGRIVLAGRASTGGDRVDIVLARFEGLPVPPAVTGVFLSGGGWSGAFKQWLANHALGDAVLGYEIPEDGAAQRTVPWINVNQITLRFDRDVSVGRGDLIVRGADGSAYEFPPLGFLYNGVNHTARWTFDGALAADRLSITWNRSGPGPDLELQLDVLPGDADGAFGRVNAADQGYVNARLNRSAFEPTSPPLPGPAYSPFADVTADGRINAADQGAVKARVNDALPVVTVQGETTSASAGITRVLFADAPILN